MANAPFNIDEGVPANTGIVSAFPAQERTFREVVEDALAVEHDMGDASTNKTARHKFGRGNTAARDAITNWVVGSIWFNTSTSPTTLQTVASVGPVVWEDVSALPLTTRGDLLTRNGAANIRLAIGAANTVLKSDGTDPSWGTIGLANIATAAKLEAIGLSIPAGVTLAAVTNADRIVLPYAFTVTAVYADVDTAQASGNILTFDINENGTTILSTKLTIDNTETSSRTAVTPAVISDASLAAGSVISFDVDQIGNGSAKGAFVTIVGYQS